jgi:hypothetical protein
MKEKEREMEQEKEEREGGELAPLEEYEIVNQVDDRTIVEMMTGQAIQEYVYSFRQGGRVIEGLTLAGINEAANRRGGIQVDEINFEERENSWIVIVKATDTYTGSSRYGACEQPKRINGREDPFAFTKAVHKAQRNAIKQLIPVPIIKEVLNFYLHRQGKKIEETQEQRVKEANDKITNAQKATFATYHRLRERLEKEGIKQEDFWGYVKRRYGVESRNDMTERQWVELSAELKAAEESEMLFSDMVKRVKQSMAAEKLFREEEEAKPPPQPQQKPQPQQPPQPRAKQEKREPSDTLFQI